MLIQAVCTSLFSVIILLMLTTGNAIANRDGLVIFTSIPPQKYLIQRITGDTARVYALTGAADSLETYAPKPGQMQSLQSADIYFPLGLVTEEKWLRILREQSPATVIVDCCQQLMSIGEGTGYRDPHIWTEAMLSLQMAEIVRDTLIDEAPEHTELYRTNYRELAAELNEVNTYISQLLVTKTGKSFIVSHPAWSYLADRFGLEQIALESEGREIGPHTMGNRIRQARERSINTVFIQQQHNSAAARRLAEEINARVVILNPLEEDHLNNLRHTAELIAASLQ